MIGYRFVVTSALVALTSACAMSTQDPAPNEAKDPAPAPSETVSTETTCPKGEIMCYCPNRGSWCTTPYVCYKLCPY